MPCLYLRLQNYTFYCIYTSIQPKISNMTKAIGPLRTFFGACPLPSASGITSRRPQR